jgi:probable F420-dependent oxidoreductase
MQLCAWFPSRDIGNDAIKVRDWAQAVEDLGYAWIDVPDHVLGANLASRPGWNPPNSHEDAFHETLVTLGYLAAVTKNIGLASGVVILPQRQAVLVAKQAAQVDLLSGGRLRLGVGVGWNPVEYEGLGEDWSTRGAREAEQVALMQQLWTRELVSFEGRFHKVTDAGINPPPIQRPIPVWFGGTSEATLARAAKLGDGWIPILPPDDVAKQKLDTLKGHLEAEGRDAATFGIEAWLRMPEDDPDTWADAVEGWRGLGADLVTLFPVWRMPSFDSQIDALRRFKEVAGG